MNKFKKGDRVVLDTPGREYDGKRGHVLEQKNPAMVIIAFDDPYFEQKRWHVDCVKIENSNNK